jgi:hypothetical protein
MGLDFFRRSVWIVDQQLRADQTARVHDADQRHQARRGLAEFLKEHDFLVGISIDGPRPIHDTYRRTRAAAAASRRSRRGWDIFGPAASSSTSSPPFTPPTSGTAWKSIVSCATTAGRDSSVHPGDRVRCRGRCRLRGSLVLLARSTPVHPERRGRHRPVRFPGRLRLIPDRRVRGMDAPRHRRGLCADVRHDARELGRRAAPDVRGLRDPQSRARPRAQRRRVFVRSLCRAAPPARQHLRAPHDRPALLRQQQRSGLDKRDTLPSYRSLGAHAGLQNARWTARAQRALYLRQRA